MQLLEIVSRHAAKLKLKAINSEFEMEVQANVHPLLSSHVDPSILLYIENKLPSFCANPSTKVDHDSIDLIIGVDYLYQCSLNEKMSIWITCFRIHSIWLGGLRCYRAQPQLE